MMSKADLLDLIDGMVGESDRWECAWKAGHDKWEEDGVMKRVPNGTRTVTIKIDGGAAYPAA